MDGTLQSHASVIRVSMGAKSVQPLPLNVLKADPEPVMASKSQYQKPPHLFFVIEFQDAAA
jgi:hypothetical protein